MTHVSIRPATRDDFPTLRAIELAAFETLRAAGAASGEPTASDAEDLGKYLEHRLLYAASLPEAEIAGWCGGYEIEGWLHVAEIDVHPDWQRKGIGRRLMQRLLDEARTRVLKGGTLTTDRWAAFNAPFYLSLGFRFVHPQDATPNLQLVLDEEAAAGLNPGRRVAMVISFDESQK